MSEYKLTREQIKLIDDFCKGKKGEQLSKDLGIASSVFSRLANDYWKMEYTINRLRSENDRVRKLFVDVSLLNQCLSDTIDELKSKNKV
jgi:DNA-binding MarR family transcriptional regulator